MGFIKYVSDSRFIDGYSKVCCTLCKFGPVHKEHAEFYSVSGPAGPTWLVQLLSKVTVRIFLDKKQLHPIIGAGCQNTKAATGKGKVLVKKCQELKLHPKNVKPSPKNIIPRPTATYTHI